MGGMISFIRNEWYTLFLYIFSSYIVCYLCYKGKCVNEKRMNNIRGWNEYYFMAVLYLVLLATLRNSNVGSDMANFYIEYFENKTSLDYNWSQFFSFHQYEPGFQFVFLLIRKISSNYRVMFLFIYSFIAYSYINFFKEMFNLEDGIIFMQVFIFYYTGNMSGVRAALGMSLVYLSIISLKDKKYGKAIILTICGIMFHYTIIYNFYIILSFMIINKLLIKRKKLFWMLCLIFTVVLSVISLNVIKELLTGTKYDYYFVDISELSFWGSIIYLFFAIICIIYFYDIEKRGKESESSLIISMCFLVTYPLLFLLGAYRIPYYYILPRLKVWGNIETMFEAKFTFKSARIIRFFCQILVWLYLIYRFYKSSLDGNFTYQIL